MSRDEVNKERKYMEGRRWHRGLKTAIDFLPFFSLKKMESIWAGPVTCFYLQNVVEVALYRYRPKF